MIGVSEFVVREYEKACQMPVHTHLLKNAIDTSKFNKTISTEDRKDMRIKLGLREDDFVVLFVGRLIQLKGILELMQAVLSIQDKRVKLLVIGSANFGKWAFSSYERKIKRLSRQNRDRIIFTGYVDNGEVYRYASAADVQCVPTLVEEAAGLVLLEAMAGGLPLIATKSGGVVEYVDKDTALLIERENLVENLKISILYLKEHPDVRKHMSDRAKIQSKKFDEAVYYQNFAETIQDILGE